MMRPIYLYTSGVKNGFVSNIYAMGNPAVFWFGLLSMMAITYYAVIERSKALGIVAFSYFAFFMPWLASPRVMFLYHYLPSVPFLALAGAYVLVRFKKLALLYFGTTILLFVYFFPHWAGVGVPVWLDNSYYWFSSWR